MQAAVAIPLGDDHLQAAFAARGTSRAMTELSAIVHREHCCLIQASTSLQS
jgi:phage tail tube protein FII